MSSSTSSTHRPRKKPSAATPAPGGGPVITDSYPPRPAFPLASFLWPAKKSTSQWVVLPLVLMVVGLFRWVLGFWGYSGFNSPPMYGDFEAQRHWMEVTTSVPISRWYFYDLGYWGLDYPPLTAYHSWLLGKIGSIINPSWFALDKSRGFEHQLLKVYMRATVLVSEYLVYVPACIILNRKFAILRGVNKWESSIALVAILMQPATLLIDHGHFQYNTVMLGFFLASVSSLLAGRLLWGSVFFVAALCFKQMALYYAPAVFAYLLGVCLLPSFNPGRFMAIAIVTIASFGLIYSPLLLGSIYDSYTSPSPTLNLESFPPRLASFLSSLDPSKIYYPPIVQLVQTTHRIFPFARGLFEDKVANIWCALNTVHKLHDYPPGMTQRVSLSATFTSILPACMIISLFPRRELFPFALASCAWGFFLFSFQVHEKSVLLPLLPMTILLGGEGGLGKQMRAWVGWANILGAWTLFPLLKRDGLQLPYFVLTLLWSYLLGLPPTSLSIYYASPVIPNTTTTTTRPKSNLNSNIIHPHLKTLHLASYTAIIIWHILEACVPAPVGKPDLYPVLNAVIGAGGFTVCWIWCTWQIILRSGVLVDYFSFREKHEEGLIAIAAGEKKVQ